MKIMKMNLNYTKNSEIIVITLENLEELHKNICNLRYKVPKRKKFLKTLKKKKMTIVEKKMMIVKKKMIVAKQKVIIVKKENNHIQNKVY